MCCSKRTVNTSEPSFLPCAYGKPVQVVVGEHSLSWDNENEDPMRMLTANDMGASLSCFSYKVTPEGSFTLILSKGKEPAPIGWVLAFWRSTLLFLNLLVCVSNFFHLFNIFFFHLKLMIKYACVLTLKISNGVFHLGRPVYEPFLSSINLKTKKKS